MLLKCVRTQNNSILASLIHSVSSQTKSKVEKSQESRKIIKHPGVDLKSILRCFFAAVLYFYPKVVSMHSRAFYKGSALSSVVDSRFCSSPLKYRFLISSDE